MNNVIIYFLGLFAIIGLMFCMPNLPSILLVAGLGTAYIVLFTSYVESRRYAPRGYDIWNNFKGIFK